MPTDNTSETLTPTIEPADELESLGYSAPLEETTTSPARLKPIEIAWLLWAKRAFLKRVLFVSLVVSTAIAFLVPKRYVATAQLMPPDFSSSSDLLSALPALATSSDGAGGAAAGGGVMGLANRLLGLNSSGDLMVGVLSSRTIADSLIQRFGLTDLYSTSYPEDTREKLARYTDFTADAKTGIISIAVEDKSPERAAAMAQAYTEELNRVLAQVNTSSAHRERVFIEQRLSEVKVDLDSSAKELSQFSSQNSTVDIPEQARAMVGAAADLQAQLIAAQSMLRGLQQIYTDSNPRIRQLQAQIAELQAQLQKMSGKDFTADGSSLSKDELYPSIRQLPLLGVRYLDLYRRSQINEAVFELLSKEYELTKLQEARNMPTVQVLDQPVVPVKKAHPSRLLIIVGGTGFCFLFGMTWIIGAASWERTDPQHPWREFAQEVITQTTACTWDSTRGRRMRARLSRIRRSKKTDPQHDSNEAGS
jgi:capsule polysaccharide export protein KpsE/RkpR